MTSSPLFQNQDQRLLQNVTLQHRKPQALRVALTSQPGEPGQWAIIWYLPGISNRPSNRGSGHRFYGGQRYFSSENEAVAVARSYIQTRPALEGAILEVEHEGYYNEKNEWVVEVEKLPVTPEATADPLM